MTMIALFFRKHGEKLVEIRYLLRIPSVTPRLEVRDVPCLIEDFGISFRLALRLQESRVSDFQQPTDKRPSATVGLQLVPGMQETLLRKVVGIVQRSTGELAQEIAHLRLVAPDQLAEGRRVL